MSAIVEKDVRVRATSRVDVRDSDLIPDEIQNLLIYWRDKIKDGYFQIGDVANDMILRAAFDGCSVKRDKVYSAVGRFCGKSGRTVRYYAETAAFYPKKVREEYEMLPFGHFVFARTLGEKWTEVLDYAAERPHISRAGLEHVFCAAPDEQMCEVSQSFRGKPGETPVPETKLSEVSHVSPTAATHLGLGIVDSFVVSMSDLMQMIGELKLRPETRRKIESATEALKQTLDEVSSAIVVQ